MRPNGLVIAMDGTAGTGKSSVGRAVAQQLGYSFLSTGGLYRALAKKAVKDCMGKARVFPPNNQRWTALRREVRE